MEGRWLVSTIEHSGDCIEAIFSHTVSFCQTHTVRSYLKKTKKENIKIKKLSQNPLICS
jgi:NADPH-dependent 7-cyano-7-deazaguanine reductase QueF